MGPWLLQPPVHHRYAGFIQHSVFDVEEDRSLAVVAHGSCTDLDCCSEAGGAWSVMSVLMAANDVCASVLKTEVCFCAWFLL